LLTFAKLTQKNTPTTDMITHSQNRFVLLVFVVAISPLFPTSASAQFSELFKVQNGDYGSDFGVQIGIGYYKPGQLLLINGLGAQPGLKVDVGGIWKRERVFQLTAASVSVGYFPPFPSQVDKDGTYSRGPWDRPATQVELRRIQTTTQYDAQLSFDLGNFDDFLIVYAGFGLGYTISDVTYVVMDDLPFAFKYNQDEFNETLNYREGALDHQLQLGAYYELEKIRLCFEVEYHFIPRVRSYSYHMGNAYVINAGVFFPIRGKKA
jgi:hypothetical protein